uniref:Lipid droplet-associated hydrolase n=1 Tax=Bombyx mori TaxID=7091 RepID=A0A8R1WJY6_BOMMO|nr:lipid droplet-associated hydrolase-like [Bombyx mori]
MKSVLVYLNNVQTHLITYGDPFQNNRTDVIICISGNPGVPDFYIEFASYLHTNTGLPVCVIGQAGHEKMPDQKSNQLQGQEHLFNLEGQVLHKLDLIHNHIEKKSKIHLIGHSIGCWMILEMLQKDELILQRLSSVNLLFPTLQKMAESKNGKLLNNILRPLHYFILLLFIIVYYLPESIRTYLAFSYLKLNSLPKHFSSRILKLCNPRVGEKIFHLAYNEMDKVNLLNFAMIDKIKHLTRIIYSNRDNWVPPHCMNDLMQYQPLLAMKEVDIEHSFVLKSSEEVAEMAIDFITSKM